MTALERFMQYVHHEPTTGCWLWGGAMISNGRGMFRFPDGKTGYAHRFAFSAMVRQLVDGENVLHRCDFGSCVNPDHLFAGSILDNSRDMANKGRGTKSRIGLPFGVRRQRSGRFQAQLAVNNRRMTLGTYDTAEEAGAAALNIKILAAKGVL